MRKIKETTHGLSVLEFGTF